METEEIRKIRRKAYKEDLLPYTMTHPEKIMLEEPIDENVSIAYLLKEIHALKEEIKNMKQKQIMITEESLAKLWDNEYDEQWNKC